MDDIDMMDLFIVKDDTTKILAPNTMTCLGGSKGHIPQLISGRTINYVPTSGIQRKVRGPIDLERAAKEAIANHNNDDPSSQPIVVIELLITSCRFKPTWKAQLFDKVYKDARQPDPNANDQPLNASVPPNAANLIHVTHASHLTANKSIEPVPKVDTTVQVPLSYATPSSDTTDLITDSIVDARAPHYTWTWTYSPSSDSVSFRQVTSATPPVQCQEKSSVAASSPSPDYGHHSAPLWDPANSRWTFNPQRETVLVVFQRSQNLVSSAQPSCIPSLQFPTGVIPEDCVVLSTVHTSPKATASASPFLLPIKLYLLVHTNILSTNWFYDTIDWLLLVYFQCLLWATWSSSTMIQAPASSTCTFGPQPFDSTSFYNLFKLPSSSTFDYILWLGAIDAQCSILSYSLKQSILSKQLDCLSWFDSHPIASLTNSSQREDRRTQRALSQQGPTRLPQEEVRARPDAPTATEHYSTSDKPCSIPYLSTSSNAPTTTINQRAYDKHQRAPTTTQLPNNGPGHQMNYMEFFQGQGPFGDASARRDVYQAIYTLFTESEGDRLLPLLDILNVQAIGGLGIFQEDAAGVDRLRVIHGLRRCPGTITQPSANLGRSFGYINDVEGQECELVQVDAALLSRAAAS
eukprot:jgi/Psemu1/48149/gm1.48149_g